LRVIKELWTIASAGRMSQRSQGAHPLHIGAKSNVRRLFW
jgi:hypothetical protein